MTVKVGDDASTLSRPAGCSSFELVHHSCVCVCDIMVERGREQVAKVELLVCCVLFCVGVC